MRNRSVMILVLAMVMAAAMATVASAAKPTCEEDSTRPWCDPTPPTTVSESEYWTCEARNDNGAIWPLGTYDGNGTYTGEGPALCVDIIAEHQDVTDWDVEWKKGTTSKDTIKGLKLVFEEEVHGTVFDETVADSSVGLWKASWPDAVQNLVFVAMPFPGDKWIEPPYFTIRPSES